MKAHIGVDSQTKVIHAVAATAANVHDSVCLPDLLHGEETLVWGDSAYQGQGEVIRRHAPKAKDFTNRRYRYKDTVDEEERAKNRTKFPCARQGRASLPHHQAHHRFREDPLQGVDEERTPPVRHLCADQSVPDAPAAVATVGGVVRLQYGKPGENGSLNDEKRASGPHFRLKLIRMHAAQPFLLTCSELP